MPFSKLGGGPLRQTIHPGVLHARTGCTDEGGLGGGLAEEDEEEEGDEVMG